MKPVGIVGIILIILGIIVLAYGGITYTRHKKVIDMGPIQASEKQHKTIPMPPALGGVVLAGGIVLLVLGMKKT